MKVREILIMIEERVRVREKEREVVRICPRMRSAIGQRRDRVVIKKNIYQKIILLLLLMGKTVIVILIGKKGARKVVEKTERKRVKIGVKEALWMKNSLVGYLCDFSKRFFLI